MREREHVAAFREKHPALIKAWEKAEREAGRRECPCGVTGCNPAGIRECEKGIRERREQP